jgi:hypothetical protein
MGNYLMSDVEKIEAVLQAAVEFGLDFEREYSLKILAERIKSALDSDDTNDTMEGQLTFNF